MKLLTDFDKRCKLMFSNFKHLFYVCCLCHNLFREDQLTTVQFDKGQLDFCFDCEKIQENMAGSGSWDQQEKVCLELKELREK